MSERNSNYFKNKLNIVTSWCGIDEEEAIRIGEPVFFNGITTSYFIEDGYDYYSAFTPVSRGNYKNALRIAGIVSLLNPDIDLEDLFMYMDALCEEKFDDGENKVDRKTMIKYMKNVKDGLYIPSPEFRKFFWVGIYNHIGKNNKEINGVVYPGRSKVVMSYINHKKYDFNIRVVLDAVASLLENGNDVGGFITLYDVSKESGVSLSTIKRYSSIFKQSIDLYNERMFDTSVYGEFIKYCSVNKITSSIRDFIKELETKITQRKVASKSGLHFNTVCKLWLEDDVQEALDEYNNWLREFKNK